MGKAESKKEKQEKERMFSKEQYEILMRCSEKKDVAEWNKWRKKNPDRNILLEGAQLKGAYLKGAYLKGADLECAHLEGANLRRANLKGAKLLGAFLSGADLTQALLRGANINEQEFLRERRFDKILYEKLHQCSDQRDIAEWNKWRVDNPKKDVLLEGANLDNLYLRGVYLNTGSFDDGAGGIYDLRGKVNLDNASLSRAHLEGAFLQGAYIREANLRAYLRGAKLWYAHLEGTDLWRAHIEDTDFYAAHLQKAFFATAQVDRRTLIAQCEADRYTDFAGVALNSACVDPGLKQLLEYNIRRLGWGKWYRSLPRLDWRSYRTAGRFKWRMEEQIPLSKRIFRRLLSGPVWFFWYLSDYGRSTGRIILTFFVLAAIFALVYWLWPNCVLVNGKVGDIRGFVHALYFSVVTMTTLGFGDIAANPDSWQGQVLLMFQVILGYVLLGALVTRFAVLFTAGGPAGKFVKNRA